MPRRRRWLWLVGLPIAAYVGFVTWAWLLPLPPVADTPAGVLPALAQIVVPLAGTDPDLDDRDLLPILPLLRDRRVVAVGETTHGTREFFQMKDRIFRLLVRHAGFTTFALEISPASGARMNAYVTQGVGDPVDILRHFEFWTWQTEEFLALARWMRSWNVDHPHQPQLSFVGINATGSMRDRQMADNVLAMLKASRGGVVLSAHNGHVATAPGWMGSYLRPELMSAYYVIGCEFSSGAFRSRNVLTLRTHAVGAASDDYYAYTFAMLPSRQVFLDLAAAAADPQLRGWLAAPHRWHDIDELFYSTRYSQRWSSGTSPWPSIYDAIFFTREGTPAHGL